MKITIEGSPKELAKLAAVLNGEPTAEKKAEIPPLLTDLVSEKFGGDNKINELAEAIRNADKGNDPQAETAEQEFVPFLVRDDPNRGHRKRIKRTTCEPESHLSDNS